MDEASKQAYRDAWESWQKHLGDVHRVLLDGERMTPDRLKGLLNREARAKERYDEARLRLLGLDDAPPVESDPNANPFR